LRASLYLAESRWLRLTAFTTLYAAQGIPIGLLSIAMPAWLADRGMALDEIAVYTAVVSLPWGFKLIAGPFMDRFTFLPMGRRRPWVLAAQGGLTLALLPLLWAPDPMTNLHTLTLMGFVINCFSAVQDVAVDGMAIDILPADERGRANALMAFGQAGGFSLFAAICGTLLSRSGLPAAALACALSVGLIFLVVTLTRERIGERLLPWSEGQAAATAVAVERNFRAIFGKLLKVLLLPMSLLLTLTEVMSRFRDGIAVSVGPTFAVQELGYSPEVYTQFVGLAGFMAAAVGIAFGPVIDRYGAKRLIIVGLVGAMALSFTVAATESLWSITEYVIAAWILASLFGQILFIGMIAQYMNICWAPVAATQFAIYMSLSNLARSIGAGLFALVAAELSYVQIFMLMGVLLLLACASMWRFDLERHQRRLDALDADSAGLGLRAGANP
jgi:PAT family beta-lactamase induction signal transducer AmpG